MEDKQNAARSAIRAAMVELLTETDEKSTTFNVTIRLLQCATALAAFDGVL